MISVVRTQVGQTHLKVLTEKFRYQACWYFLLQLVVFSSFIFPRKFILLHLVRKLITLQQMKLLLVNCNLYLKQVAVEQVLELILTRCEVDRLPENCCHLQGQCNFFLYFKDTKLRHLDATICRFFYWKRSNYKKAAPIGCDQPYTSIKVSFLLKKCLCYIPSHILQFWKVFWVSHKV